MEKSIAWITPRCFVETDIYAIELLSLEFKIDWYIIEPCVCDEYSQKIESFSKKGVRVNYVYLPAKNRSIKTLKCYYRLLKTIKTSNYDLVYNAIFGMPYYMPLEALLLPKDKVVIALHNVTTPKGAKASSFISKAYTNFVAHAFRNYHTFSLSQCNILKSIAKGANVFHIPFVLKDYGKSEKVPSDVITFLFFGQILDYKRLDVLIQAAEQTYAQTNKSFKVKIAGSCKEWSKYEALIKNKNLYDVCIRRIANEEIPDLFSSSHYFVMPYQDIAQSGAVIVAINYNLPVIASALPAFKEYIIDNVNGRLMTPACLPELTQIMVDIVNNHKNEYTKLKTGMKNTKSGKFSEDYIRNRYSQEFNNLIK